MNYRNKTQIDLLSLLASYDIHPVKNRDHKFWFNSPLRSETKPSFLVDAVKNLWYDFGLGEGGDAITFVCRLKNVDIKEAFKIISGNIYEPIEKPVYRKDKSPKESSLKILKVITPIQRFSLIDYLKERRIDYFNIKSCNQLKELNYSVENKKYYGIGFENDKRGFEIRNAFWKGASSPKSITTIEGNPKIVNVFEGFMDYLSALTYYKTAFPSHTSIVLNGTGQTKTLLGLLPQFEKIHLYVDNDEAGKRVAAQVKEAHRTVINQSENLYPHHKDFNEFLCSIKV